MTRKAPGTRPASSTRLPRYRAIYRGMLRLTKYRREQTAYILAMERVGSPRDAIAQATGVPVSSLDYVAELQHLDEEE